MTTAAHSFIPMAASTSVSNNSRMVLNAGCAHHDTFPTGLRVLVVDDDPVCLFILKGILRKCQYQVTACGRAAQALSMLRENRDNFDVIISDVHMPDMDGFKLLELVGLEMDLPVIMMSADGETSTVMKGIKHGACDYLLKPIRIEELRNIWQHVLRKKWRSSRQHSSHADDRGKQEVAEDGDHNDSSNGGYDGTWKQGKRLKDLKEDEKDLKEDEEDGDLDSDDPSASKKPRVVWSVELHQQFVNAVNQLGIDKAVPKRILELMNVSGLTRENVASHLQKYRLCMKKLSSGVTNQSAAMNPSFSVSSNTNFVPVNAAGLVGLGEMRSLTGPINELTSRAVLLPTLQAGALGSLGHASGSTLRPPFLPSCSHLVQKNQCLQVGPLEPNLTPMSTVVASPGVRSDNVPHGLSPMQGQQLEAAGNLVGLEQLAGASNNVPQISQDIILMQALQEQQGAGKLMNKAGLALPLVSTDAGAWAASFSSFNGADGMSNGILGQYGGAPRLETVPVYVASGAGQSRRGPLQRKTDAESRGLYGLLGNTANRAQPGLSTDAGVWGPLMSHLNASCGIAGQTDDFLGTEVPTMGGASPGSALPGPLHRTMNTENEVQQTSADSVLNSGTTDILFSRLRGMEGTVFPPINEGLPHSLGPRFSLLPGLRQGHHMGHITQGALQGSDSSREYEQAGSRALQPPSYGPGLNYSGGPGREELRDLLKQQQEGLGLMGMEPGAADGQVFSNMYVK